MKVLIMGMGAIGHSIAASINCDHIDVLVSSDIQIDSIESTDGKFKNKINQVFTYDNIETIDHDYLFVTLPYQYKIERMEQIKSLISPNTTIVYMPGNQGILAYMPSELAKHKTILFERVIHISRVEEYGKSVNIYGTKNNMHIYTSADVNNAEFETLFPHVDNLMYHEHSLDIVMISSNAVIHNPRTYRAFFKENMIGEEFFFYTTWTDEDSETFIKMEQEIMAINSAIEKERDITIDFYSMFDHFGTSNENPVASELTHNISTAPSFQAIKFYAETRKDLAKNRYIVDDMVIGLHFYIELAKRFNVETPMLKAMYDNGKAFVETLPEEERPTYEYPLNLDVLFQR